MLQEGPQHAENEIERKCEFYMPKLAIRATIYIRTGPNYRKSYLIDKKIKTKTIP